MHGCSPRAGSELLAALARGLAVEVPALVVVAHPDDETVGLGARLASFRALTLLCVTDGAPRAPDDWRRHGFQDRQDYGRVRAGELRDALDALGVEAVPATLGLCDQEAALDMAGLAAALIPWLERARVVITHAYEGGHPDHDAVAFAVAAGIGQLRAAGRPAPAHLEFAGYHQDGGQRAAGRFWPDHRSPEHAARITPEQLDRKRVALAAHRTQAEVLGWFDPAVERYRAAPPYDFAAPPPPGAALYDAFGWRITSPEWRERAGAALEALTTRRPAWA